MPLSNQKVRINENRERARRAYAWCTRAGITDSKLRTQISIDLADAVSAADALRFHVDEMLRTNPAATAGRARALEHAAGIEGWALVELLDHLKRLKRNWEPTVFGALATRPASKTTRRGAKRARRKSAA